MAIVVIIPLLNPNEPDTLIASIEVEEGQKVSVGDLICSLETTKSTAELRAEKEGYIVRIRFKAGETVPAGETLCYISSDLNEEFPDREASPSKEHAADRSSDAEVSDAEVSVPEGVRITQPALKLARERNLDLEDLPRDTLLTENWIREHTGGKAVEQPGFLPPPAVFDPNVILIYGGGGHAKMVIDLLKARGGYKIAGILDDGRQAGEQVLGVPVLGGGDLLPELFEKGVHMAVNAVGGIGNIAIRIKVFQRLTEGGFVCPALVHPTAYIDPTASLSAGVQVFAKAYLGSEVQAGYGCILNTGAIVSHDCILGDFVNLSPGAILAGEVEIGSGALVGMGVTINLAVKVGEGARIGNGATIKSDVPAGGVVRAGAIWPA
jgi:acetyltransferase EpsM